MARFLKSRAKAKGAAPGSLIFMGDQKMDAPRIRLFNFNDEISTENEYHTIEEALDNIKLRQINWLNIDGLHEILPIQKIGKHYNISPIALDNVLNTGQRSKFFEDKNSLTIVVKAVYYDPENNKISVEQISFILCKDIIISLQEKPGDHFEPVRERIRNNIGRIRNSAADYLLYTLIDSLIDNNLIIIEQIGDKVEQIEHKLSDPNKEVSAEIFHYKTEISYFRKTVRPLKEVITRLLRSNSKLIDNDSIIYFQELNDLIEHSIEALDTYFSMIGDQLNILNTYLSNRVNDVMKVLTIFASIFIPLTFIAGVYGTNFEFVPELSFRYSYFIMWGLMITVSISMLYYFKKNKWF
ncbi:MAG: magnesium/cobalt transporter CorA [Bacteroidetes bacterium]|nr:magnesium/cobalt transporter CorA [Bacteroidota bacterium]